MTLALLLTAVTGAWAEETPLVTITIDSKQALESYNTKQPFFPRAVLYIV